MLEKKKILHLITGLEIGGAEMMLLKTLPHLQNDFDNRVCCIRGHGPIGKQLEVAGISVLYLDLKLISVPVAILRFWRIVEEFSPDILVTYLIHADLFGRILGRLFGIKKIVCNQRGKLLQWEFLRFFDRATKFFVTKYIVQTEITKNELMGKLRLPDEKFVVIPNAINVSEFNFEVDSAKKRAEIGLGSNDMIIICVSKLRRGKGHEYLLEAFESISQRHHNTHLLIVGDGERRGELMHQIGTYQSKSNVHFLGNRNDVKELLKISNVFVLATEGEGMSNAIMEAMASSLPIITTDIPENRKLIRHGDTGILVPKKDSLSIATSVESFLNGEKNLSLLAGNAKRRVATDFDMPVIIRRIVALYDQLLA